MVPEPSSSPLAAIEPRLRWLLPATLYATAWVDPSPQTLSRTFGHLRTLRHILFDYLPRQISENPPRAGEIRYIRREGTLMFTDLAGFTRLLEANAAYGRAGAEMLLIVLNRYFTEMIEIVSKSGGILLEFTGDAMLAQFSADQTKSDTARAVRAGLRMQRAMEHFAHIETMQGTLSLGMRIGIHTGPFLAADIGTPRRMEQVLVGNAVLRTKRTEGAGRTGRVNLTQEAYERVRDQFEFEAGAPGYMLVVDNLAEDQLGEYDITLFRRRLANPLLLDRSIEGLVSEITSALNLVEPLASYLPLSILNLIVENATHGQISPNFPELSVMFVNLLGLTEAIDCASSDELEPLVNSFSHIFALINAEVEARGGVLKNVTYHLTGSDMLIYFGVPNAHADDSLRAASAALAIRDIITNFTPPVVAGEPVRITSQIGLAYGSVFAAEIGETRGRREFNILGDTVNIAARLMSQASENQILITEAVHTLVQEWYECEALGLYSLKGKAVSMPLFALHRLHPNTVAVRAIL